MTTPEDAAKTPIDITGEFVPVEGQSEQKHLTGVSNLQKLVDAGLGYFDEDGDYCHITPRDIYED